MSKKSFLVYEAREKGNCFIYVKCAGFLFLRKSSSRLKRLMRVVLLQVTTTIGFGSPNKANSYSVHGSALGAKEVDATRKNLGWPYEPFHVPEDVKK